MILVDSYKGFLIKIAASNASMEELLSKISSINKGRGSVVQLFDPKSIINQTHLSGAYVDAAQSFKDGT